MKKNNLHEKTSLLILLVFLSSFQTLCFIEKETHQSEINSGTWSDPITAVHEQWTDPAQHFLCGFAVREMKFTKMLYNCNCGNKIDPQGVVAFKCEWCENTFWSMRNGFKAIFCRIGNWSSQITKVFETGNTDSRNWKEYKCPKGTFVRQAAARTGVEQEVILGVVGMQMICSNLEMDQTFKVEDNAKQPLEELSENSEGTFVSTVQIKFEKGGKLTGIKWIFEGIAYIKEIEMKYGEIVGNKTKKIIQSMQIVNNAKQATIKKILFSNNYTTVHTFTLKSVYFSGYSTWDKLQAKPPQLQMQKDEGLYQIIRSQNFKFGTPLTNKYIPSTSLSTTSAIYLPIPSSSNFTVSTVVQELKTTVSFEMTMKFINKITEEFICERTVGGVQTGVVETPVTMMLQQNQCFAGWGEKNFIVNGDFQLNKCYSGNHWCVWDQTSIKDYLPGWIPNPQIQIGQGFLYNPIWGNTWISEIDTCIKQKIKLDLGIYSLSFDRIARSQIPLQSSQMEVKFNGTSLKKIFPQDYFLHRENIEFKLAQPTKQYQIEFCELGNSDGYGITIDNVKIIQYNDCATMKDTKY